jgi:hypothetical protein
MRPGATLRTLGLVLALGSALLSCSRESPSDARAADDRLPTTPPTTTTTLAATTTVPEPGDLPRFLIALAGSRMGDWSMGTDNRMLLRIDRVTGERIDLTEQLRGWPCCWNIYDFDLSPDGSTVALAVSWLRVKEGTETYVMPSDGTARPPRSHRPEARSSVPTGAGWLGSAPRAS